jgi:hypothetical protein
MGDPVRAGRSCKERNQDLGFKPDSGIKPDFGFKPDLDLRKLLPFRQPAHELGLDGGQLQ